MANHDNYVIQGNTLDAIASEVKTLVDTSDKMTIEQITDNIAHANIDIETQTDLIAQIKTALEGKAAGSGSEIIAEIVSLIDQSGALDSTEGTVEDKVEQLVDKAEDENAWYQYTSTLTEMPTWAKATCETLPRMNLSNIKSLSYRFSFMPNLKRVDFYINSESCTRADNVFSASSQLEYVKGLYTAKCTKVEAMFNGCVSLKTIEEPLDFSLRSDTWSVFNGCNALENVRFVSKCIHTSIAILSPVLSAESIQSIIDGLATVETAQTLTLHADVKAKLTEEQLATITNKNWNLA